MEDKRRLIQEEHLSHNHEPSILKWTINGRNARNVLAMGALICFTIPYLLPHFWIYGRQHCHHGPKDETAWKYDGEAISWRSCGDTIGWPFECSDINVPVDQFDRAVFPNKTFTIPLIRLRSKNATKNLLVNPGGPGGSGWDFVLHRGEMLSAIVGDGFHVVGFDPRGVGKSTPKATCYPDDGVRQEHSLNRGERVVDDSPEVFAWSMNIARACQDSSGDYGPYVNTPQTAADMNSILDAIGEDGLSYWGFSYGTHLGQTYATLFPDRSHRVMIDGVGNNYDWFEVRMDFEMFKDTERVLAGFFDECIKTGPNCALSKFGSTPKQIQHKVFSLLERLGEEPLSIYVNSTVHGILTREKVLDGIFMSLYKPIATWYSLADRLAKLLDGNPTEAFLAYGAPGGLPQEDSGIFVMANDGIYGRQKHWPQDRLALLEKVIEYFNQSIFAPTMLDVVYPREQWRMPRTHNFTQTKSVKTAHPLLILSNSYDPISPLISALSAKQIFEGSQIVELTGYGHCTLAIPSKCVRKHIRNFLYEGIVPEDHSYCEVETLYFNDPKDGSLMSVEHSEEDDEQDTYRAQYHLAMDESWLPSRFGGLNRQVY